MKKLFIILLAALFLQSLTAPLHAYTQMPEFLCEIGVRLYLQGRYGEALHEFKKALLIKPDFGPALNYIRRIEKEQSEQVPAAPAVAPEESLAIQQDLLTEKQKKAYYALYPQAGQYERKAIPEALPLSEQEPVRERQGLQPAAYAAAPQQAGPDEPGVLTLDKSLLAKMAMPIKIEKDKSIIVVGENISRFLITSPDVITAKKISSNELLVTGQNYGFSYLHVWDDRDRWTLEFLTMPPEPEGPTLEEEARRAQERSRNFKLRYYMDWTTFETGRRMSALKRLYYSFYHLISLHGPSPYGDIDSSLNVRTLRDFSEVSYYTLGLEHGKIGPFKDFSLRAMDFSPDFTNVALGTVSLRGVKFSSPAFNKLINYTAFWGRDRISGSNFGSLSPGITKTRNAFLSGMDIVVTPSPKQKYEFSVFHGWGRDRQLDLGDLNDYGYDLKISRGFDRWALDYEAGYDSESLANLLTLTYSIPEFKVITELRDIDKDFNSMTGIGPRAGEIGVLSTFYYTPRENLRVSGQANIFRDRRFPAEDNPNRWNEDFNAEATYTIDPSASLRADYSIQNELGRTGQIRYLSPGLGINKTFDFIKKVNTFLNYRFQRNQNFTAPTLDYTNHKIIAGIRFSLIGELYYYLNREENWLQETFSRNRSMPAATETGVDWQGRFFNTPLSANITFTYRDEEHTTSPLSFLSGEDYIEGYSELTYRFPLNGEAYLSTRVRNIWADNPNVVKRVEADIRGGLRYTWDTGVCWESVGNIEGYVFRDLNSDGLRQNDEPPVEGVRVLLGKELSANTDLFGYYLFTGIRGAKAFVNFDTSTLPAGFVLTVPQSQEAPITNHRASRVDFGIISRSEISGFIFEDSDNNGNYDRGEKPLQGAVVTLENGAKAVSEANGRYTFSNASTGEHTLTLNLSSVPVHYLPSVPLTKKITLSEGVTYIYNIPLKRVKQ